MNTLEQLSIKARLLTAKANVAKMNSCHNSSDGRFCSSGGSSAGASALSVFAEQKAQAAANKDKPKVEAASKPLLHFPSPSFVGTKPAPAYLKNWWGQAQGKEDKGVGSVQGLVDRMSDKQLKTVLHDLNGYRHTKDKFLQALFTAVGDKVNAKGGVK